MSLLTLVFGITAVAITANGGSPDLSNSDLWRTLAGALIRNLAAAIATALAWIALVEGLRGGLLLAGRAVGFAAIALVTSVRRDIT